MPQRPCAPNEFLCVLQERNGKDVETFTIWDACGEAVKAVLALLKAAEPNPASTNALVGFLTGIIARWSVRCVLCVLCYISAPALACTGQGRLCAPAVYIDVQRIIGMYGKQCTAAFGCRHCRDSRPLMQGHGGHWRGDQPDCGRAAPR